MAEPRYFKRPARSACPGHETPEGARYCNGSCHRGAPPPLVSRDHLQRMPALITARYALERGQGLLPIERTAVLAELAELDQRRAAESERQPAPGVPERCPACLSPLVLVAGAVDRLHAEEKPVDPVRSERARRGWETSRRNTALRAKRDAACRAGEHDGNPCTYCGFEDFSKG